MSSSAAALLFILISEPITTTYGNYYRHHLLRHCTLIRSRRLRSDKHNLDTEAPVPKRPSYHIAWCHEASVNDFINRLSSVCVKGLVPATFLKSSIVCSAIILGCVLVHPVAWIVGD